MGPQEDIYTVALLPEEGPEDFQRKFEETIARLEEFVVFADLLGVLLQMLYLVSCWKVSSSSLCRNEYADGYRFLEWRSSR